VPFSKNSAQLFYQHAFGIENDPGLRGRYQLGPLPMLRRDWLLVGIPSEAL